jgi:rhodanese-related sulfurtransferase
MSIPFYETSCMRYTVRMKKFLIVLALAVGAFSGGFSLATPDECGAACPIKLQTVTAVEFKEKLADKEAVLLDVRTSQEYAEGHLASAQLMDFNNREQFEKQLETLDKNATYMIYCRSGNRSGQALTLMQEKGFIKVTNLEGGIQSWLSKVYEVVK